MGDFVLRFAWRAGWGYLASCLLIALAAIGFLMLLWSSDPAMMAKLGAAAVVLVVLLACCGWLARRGEDSFVRGTDRIVEEATAALGRFEVERDPASRCAHVLVTPSFDALLALAGWLAFVAHVGTALSFVTRAVPAGAMETVGAVYVGSGLACLAASVLYAGIGRIWIARADRAAVRPLFRPYLMGAAIGIALLVVMFQASLYFGEPTDPAMATTRI